MKYVYRYWILVPLLLLAVISRDWVEEPTQQEIEATIDMTRSEADYYLEKFETRKLDQLGHPEYVVTGATLSHFPEDDSSVIEQPELVLFREGVVWTMNSRQGKLTQNPETFFFEGQVSMLRQPAADSANLNTASNNADQQDRQQVTANSIRLETSDVFVRTEQNTVETDKPIKVTAANWQLSSIGLKSNIDDGSLELLSNVTGRYEVDN